MEGANALNSTYMRSPFAKRYDADGKVWMWVYASANLTALTPYAIQCDEYGPFAEVLSAAGEVYWVGVPHAAVSSGDNAWLQIGGYVANMITANLSVTAGHSLTAATSAVADGAAAYTGTTGEFCINTATTVGQTIHTVILVPERITAA